MSVCARSSLPCCRISAHNSSQPNEQKAAGYIQQLYEARCNGNWQAVPELARKVEKHAPSRKCLALASRAGALIYAQPGQSTYQKANEQYGAFLSESIKHTETTSEDVLDGIACRASMLYGMGDATAALGLLPSTLARPSPPSLGLGLEGWTATCVIISFLVRGLSLEHRGDLNEAASSYRPIISYCSALVKLPSIATELRRWTEELLCHICLLYTSEAPSKPAQPGEAMAVFHILSQLLETQSGALSPKFGSLTHETPRQVWKAYYASLTKVIHEGLVYHPSPVERDHDVPEHRGLLEDEEYFSARTQQRKDLRNVETSYEALLMRETTFPKAEKSNVEVRDFVEDVVSNWRAFCGPSWTERELEDGGKTAISRRVLDILYRAATKTFHSPQILRHLFTVHAYLSSFDLAFKSLDSYLGIVTKGKARAEKSGEAGLDLDSDDQMILFVAEAIRVACRYGASISAEKALVLAATLSKWLHTGSTSSLVDHGAEKHLQKTFQPPTASHFGAETTALALRAIGMALANWSRLTYEADIRAIAQELATAHLEQALQQGLHDAQCTETFYTLAILVAETRQIPEAIALVRRALKSDDETVTLAEPDGVSATNTGPTIQNGLARRPAAATNVNRENGFTRIRKLLPIWHLLAQLLSACEEFEAAASACQMGIQSFVELFGSEGSGDAVTLQDEEHYMTASALNISATAAASLDHYEKQTLLEMQMTSIALLELNEGPSVALNASNDLLAFYAQLYGPVKIAEVSAGRKPQENGLPPRSSHGTIRSIFGRNKHRSIAAHSTKTVDGAGSTRDSQGDRPDTAVQAPSIQVTSHGDETEPNDMTEKHAHTETGKLQRKTPGSVRSRKSREPISNGHDEKSELKQVASASQQMPKVPHNAHHKKLSLPVGHASQPPRQDTRLPAPAPSEDNSPMATHFSQVQSNRQKSSLLVKIWLFIAGLYRAAGQFEDAQDALEEALQVIENLELEVASIDASVKKMREKDWGNSSSIDSLWADAYSERGDLLKARGRIHDAAEAYETALSHHTDHPRAIVGLSEILLDVYCQKTPFDKHEDTLGGPSDAAHAAMTAHRIQLQDGDHKTYADLDTPTLYRLAARDRAYCLLSALTKLGTGWDDSETWIQYARALEESGQVEKAKEALWWTVELEDTKPVRHWRNVSPGGHVL